MMKSIKSLSITKKIYTFLDERIKLDIIKYNKKIKKLMNVTLINYKFLSGRYTVFDNGTKGNGKGKEYDGHTNKLIFEGEYLNRKRNGKGREYSLYGELIFDGQFLNGKRHGKGKEYADNDKNNLIYEGEYLNGLKNGKGKEYDLYGKLYEGEYLKGKKHGKGKEYDINGKLIYEGEYINGKRINVNIDNIRTIIETSNKTNNILFEGDINGKGKEYGYKHIIFEGEYLNRKRHGNGKGYNDKGGLILECEYRNGKMWNAKGYDEKGNKTYEIINGKGHAKELSYRGELLYDGEYLNGQKNGKGKEYFYDRLFEDEKYKYITHFEGEYLYGHKRKGKEYFNKILIYEGDYLFDNKWDGKGYDENGNIIYELHNGAGNLVEYYIYPDSIKFEGNILNGVRHGLGKEYRYPFCYCHPTIYEGKYLNGLKHGVWKINGEDGLVFVEYIKGKEIKESSNQKNYDELIFDNNQLYMTGKAKEYKKGKLIYEGEYIDGKRNGKGKEYDDKGNLIYEGEFYNGKRDGKGIGKEYNEYSKLIYEGEYIDGIRNGRGKEYDDEGNFIYEGEFIDGIRNGIGKEYNENGKLIYEGEYLNDKKWNGKEYHYDNMNGKLLFECKYLKGKILFVP